MSSDNQHITGIILAGGKSSRMGSEKGLMMLHSKAFIDHIIDALQPLVQELIIVSNCEAYDSLGYKRYEDILKDAGPLAGLYTGLYYSHTEKNLVVSCDVPLVTTKVLQSLIDTSLSEASIVQYQSHGKLMPLVALYKKHCEQHCLELLAAGERRLLELSKHVKTKTIVLETKLEKYVQNINTKEQLKAIENEYTA